MSEDKMDWSNDSERADMTCFDKKEIAEAMEEDFDWADEAETEESNEELRLREAEAKKEAPAKRELPSKDVKPDVRRNLHRTPYRSDRRTHKPSNVEYTYEAYIQGLPLSFKKEDVRKFLTSVKEPVEDDKIEGIKTWLSPAKQLQVIVSFKDNESLKKILKAHKTVVEGKEVSIQMKYHSQRRSAPRVSRRPTSSSSGPSYSSSAKPNPFGEARPNDKQMNREREQIAEEEQKKAAAAAAAAPAPAPDAAAAATTENATATAPAAPAEGEAKPEVKAEGKLEQKQGNAASAKTSAKSNAKNAKKDKGGKNNATSAKDAAKTKAEEDKKKALKKQQKDRERKRKEEADANRKNNKTFNPYSALGDTE